MSAHRRGLCPTLVDPLPTGDGLLARWLPLRPLSLETFVALCEGGERDGNGIIEVTQRGSLQFRGFNESTAGAFLHAFEALGLASNTAPPIWSSPLLGLDPETSVDLRDWVVDLRAALRERYLADAINPKVSVLVDDGGAVHLDELFADLRLRWGTSSHAHVSIGGTASTATALGWIALERATAVVREVLDDLVSRGRAARSRDLRVDAETLRTRFGLERADVSDLPSRRHSEPLDAYRLRDGRFARGVGLAFGYSDAAQLKGLVGIAERHGADAVRPALDRTLLVIGLRPDRILDFAADAEAAGFVVSSRDARRQVVACAGAPGCESAMIRTRELAPLVANAVRGHLPEGAVIHLSGCTKGCAHPRPAAVALAGPNRVVIDGRADGPVASYMTPAEFIDRASELLRGAHRQ